MTNLERLLLIILAVGVIAVGAVFASLQSPHKDDTLPPPKRHEMPYFGKVWRDPADGICMIDTGCVVVVYPCDEKNVAICGSK